MADYVFFRKSRNALSSFLHVVLNLLLGVGSVFLTVLSGSWIVGALFVALSKWRVFAVQPRYLLLNIKSNLVDFIVGISCVLLASFAGTEIVLVDWILAAFYSVWLLFIKPMSSESGALAQAIISIFLGTTAATLLASSSDSIILVLAAFLIGYSASRHLLAQDGEKELALSTITNGLIFAEISWLCYSWIITYTFTLPDNSSIIIPQLSIFLSIIFYVIHDISKSIQKHDEKLVIKEVAPTIVYGVIVIAILLFGFSSPAFNLY